MASSTKHIYNMEITSTRNLHIQGAWQEQVPHTSPHPSGPPPPPTMPPTLAPQSTTHRSSLKLKTGPRTERNRTLDRRGSVNVKWVPHSFPYLTSLSIQNPHQRIPEFSNHEGILILQLFKFFDLLSQKKYPLLTQCGLYLTHTN